MPFLRAQSFLKHMQIDLIHMVCIIFVYNKVVLLYCNRLDYYTIDKTTH